MALPSVYVQLPLFGEAGRPCRHCGAFFPSGNAPQRYCSLACRQAAENMRREARQSAWQTPCAHCGRTFRPRYTPSQRYCSQHCAHLASRHAGTECVCVQCGATFVLKQGARTRYGASLCSRACWQAAHASDYICAQCGRGFWRACGRACPRYCSVGCYLTARRPAHAPADQRSGRSTFWQVEHWRRDVLRRDGACQDCGTTTDLQAHHIRPWASAPALRFDRANGMTLCVRCHQARHHGAGVGYGRGRVQPRPVRLCSVCATPLSETNKSGLCREHVRDLLRKPGKPGYRTGNTCPVCGVPIKDGARHCWNHAANRSTAALTDELAALVRAAHKEGRMTAVALARAYGLSPSTVYAVLAGRLRPNA